MRFPEPFQVWDEAMLLAINAANSPFWDMAMYQFSAMYIWLPLYILLFIFVFRKFGWKVGLIVILGLILVITLCDQISVNAFKERFVRLRPCHSDWLNDQIHMVEGKGCGGKYGFVSSHATNTFGIAIYFASLLRKWWFSIVLVLWAAVVSYSRVYLGVHFPLDILGGAMLGSSIGFFVFWAFRFGIKRTKFG